jgi:hypothetical protein
MSLSKYLYLIPFLICCQSQPKKFIKEISNAIKVDSSYRYSNKADTIINGNYYSLKNKAFYDEDGNIESLFVYRTEDIVNYTKQEIFSDIKLLEHLELSSQISFVIETNNLVDKNGVKDILEKIDDDLFISEKDGKVVLYKIGNY